MPKVALVTGANQGLGFALVRGLCRQRGEDWTVYLGARDRVRGETAVRELNEEGLSPVLLHLDVTDDASVDAAATRLRDQHGGVDLVISNAAARISPDSPPGAQVGRFVDTNNHGTYRMLRAFLPLLRDHARFLVVASSFGSLRNLPPALHDRFDGEGRTLEDVEAAMDEYAKLIEAGTAADHGWPEWINIPSKVGQVASTRIASRMVARDHAGRGIRVHAVCPGLVDTGASRPWFPDMSGAQTTDQAAVDVLWLATRAEVAAAPVGELIQHRRVLPFR